MKKIIYKLYLLTDSLGNKTSVIAEDASDNVGPFTLKDKDGEEQSFEAEAYHLNSYCDEHSIEMRIIEREEDFDALWVLPDGKMTIHVVEKS